MPFVPFEETLRKLGETYENEQTDLLPTIIAELLAYDARTHDIIEYLRNDNRDVAVIHSYLTPVMIGVMQEKMLDEVHACLNSNRRVDATRTYRNFVRFVMRQEIGLIQAKEHIEMIEAYVLGITR